MTQELTARRFLANVRWEMVWGPGSLTIGENGVEIAGLRRREALNPTSVTMDTAACWVPWANVYIRLVDPEIAEPPVAAIPLWMRPAVVGTFERAGYRVERTWHLFASADRLP